MDDSTDKKVAQEYGRTYEKDSDTQQSCVLHGSILFLQTRFIVISGRGKTLQRGSFLLSRLFYHFPAPVTSIRVFAAPKLSPSIRIHHIDRIIVGIRIPVGCIQIAQTTSNRVLLRPPAQRGVVVTYAKLVLVGAAVEVAGRILERVSNRGHFIGGNTTQDYPYRYDTLQR